MSILNKNKLNLMSEDKAPSNEFRIGIKSKPKDLITQCEKLLKDDKVKDLHLSGVGNSIGEVVTISEILKSMYPNLFQKTIFSTIPGRTTDSNKEKKADPKQLFPKLEIILSTEKIVEKKENSVQLSEEEKQLLIDTLEKKKELVIKRRKFRRPFRKNRQWGYNTRRQRFAYSAKRIGYNTRRYGFNNIRRPYGTYGKKPIRKKLNVRKFNGAKKNTGNKQANPAKN